MALQIVYDKLLDFSVFQGLNKREMENIIANTRFGFHKYAKNLTLIKADSVCDRLCFILSGKVILIKESDDHSYMFYEEIPAPAIIEPEVLFGHKQRFSFTVRTASEVGMMTVSGEEVSKFLEQYPIVRMNMVNLLSTHIQELMHSAWKRQSNILEKRLVDFVAVHCIRKAGRKEIKIKMVDLARELNDGRLNVSRTLNKLQLLGLLNLQRGGFVIPALERLICSIG